MLDKNTGKIMWTADVERPRDDVLPVPMYRSGNTLLLLQANRYDRFNQLTVVNLSSGVILWEDKLPFVKSWSIAAFGDTFYYRDFDRGYIDLYAGKINTQPPPSYRRPHFASIPLSILGYEFERVTEPIAFLHPQTKEKMLFLAANAVSHAGDSVRGVCFLYNLSTNTLVYSKELSRGKTSFWGLHGIDTFDERVQVNEYYILNIYGKSFDIVVNMAKGEIAWVPNERIIPYTEPVTRGRPFAIDTLNYHLWYLNDSYINDIPNLARCVDIRTGREVYRRGILSDYTSSLNIAIAKNILYLGAYSRWVGIDVRDGKILFQHDWIDNMAVYGAISVVEDRVFVTVSERNFSLFTRVYNQEYLYCLQAIEPKY